MVQQTPETPEATQGYEPPTVIDYGSLTEITAGQTTGAVTDADFPAGTAIGDLTFS